MVIKLGDVHGDWKKLLQLVKLHEISDCDIISVGDFGIGFGIGYTNRDHIKEQRTLKILHDYLVKKNINMFVIRGNHDNPDFFNGNIQYETPFPNIILLPDYSVITINGEQYLCVGGAYSTDRKPNYIQVLGIKNKGRTEGKDYWVNEPFVLDEERLKMCKNIDYVITHSAPNFAYPVRTNDESLPMFKNDKQLRLDLIKERADLTRMYEILAENNNIKAWYYGHFHKSNADYINGTKFVLLGINEMQY